MKITLDTSDDQQLRAEVRALINEQLLSITREEIRTMIEETSGRALKEGTIKRLVDEFNVTEMIRIEARAAVTARLEQVFK